jgi:hypothetical protein
MQLLTHDPEPTDGEIATRLFLSVPIHPTVLEHPISYGLSMGLRYYSFHRAKTDKKVMGAWSAAMTDPAVIGRVLPLAGATRRWYHQLTSDHARDRGIAGLCGPLRLRHTYFCNLARLGTDPFSMAHRSGTGLGSIYQHYTVGMGESSLLSPEELKFLVWLMLPGRTEEKP